MFILIYNNGSETVSSDNLAWAYPTFDRAYHEMVRQLEEAAAKEGLTLLEHDDSGDFEGHYGEDPEFSEWQGFIDKEDALLYHTDERWVIHEIPGAFIPKEDCDGFLRDMDTLNELYAEEQSASDRYVSDELCQNIVWALSTHLKEA